MRYLLVVFCIIILFASAAWASDPALSNHWNMEKDDSHVGMNPSSNPRQGGDTIFDATVIAGIPYSDAGTTAGYNDDYDEVCPYSGSTSPDVVYIYDAPASIDIDIDLCGSTYDTKLYVYDGGMNLVACNDDFYFDDICGLYVSKLEYVHLVAGETYYIIIDGYGGDYGDYLLDIQVHQPCVVDCPPGALLEGEPTLVDDYEDFHNGGCNTDNVNPPFQDLWGQGNGTVQICGVAGWYNYYGSNYRDTDWFQIYMGDSGVAEITIDAEVATYLFEVGPQDCNNVGVLQNITVGPCSPGSMFVYGNPHSPVWIWVGPTVFYPPDGFVGNEYDYVMTISGIEDGDVPLGTIVINPDPDILDAPWHLEGPAGYSHNGFGDVVLTDMAVGDYTLTWGDVLNWATPEPNPVEQNLGPDGTITFNGTYVSLGTGTVHIDPNPDSLNAPWELVGPASTESGDGDQTLNGMAPGPYTLTWGEYAGWNTPEPNPVSLTLEAGAEITFSGIYTGQLGTVIVNPQPDGLDAPWHLVVPPSGYDYFGTGYEILTDMPAGYYLLTWEELTGWAPPEPNPVEQFLETGGTITFTGIYMRIPDWANLQWPPNMAVSPGHTSPDVYGQVYLEGVTDAPGPGGGITAQLGFGPDGTDPTSAPGWLWGDADYNTDIGNRDEYVDSFTVPSTGTYDYCYRYWYQAGPMVYGDLNGSDDGYTIDRAGSLVVASEPGWWNLQWPPDMIVNLGDESPSVYGRVWLQGITDKSGQGFGIVVQVGYGPDGSDPAVDPGWQWVDAVYHLDYGNDDEYVATFTPGTVGTYDYCYRYAINGSYWVFGDLDGADNGYSPDQAGLLVVTQGGASTDVISMNAEPDGTGESNLTIDIFNPFDVYMILQNPSEPSGVSSWECSVTYTGDVSFLGWSAQNGAVIVGDIPGSIIVGVYPVLPWAESILLATLNFFRSSTDSVYIYIGDHEAGVCSPNPCYTAGDDPSLYIPMTIASGSEDLPVFVVSTEPPVCKVTPSTVDFGTVELNATRDLAFTIQNVGSGIINGNVSETCSQYNILSGDGPFNLSAGELATVNVQFEPTVVGYHRCLVDLGNALCERLVFVADEASGLRIYNAKDPATLTDVGVYDTDGSANKVFISGYYAYLADGPSGLQILSIADPADPVWLGSCATPHSAQDVQVVGDYAYVTAYNQGLRVMDVSDPTDPTEVGSYVIPGTGYAYGVFVVGNYAYVAASESGLVVIDISVPTSPTPVASYDTPVWAWDVFVSGDYAYIADGWGLIVVNISDPANPVYSGGYQIGPWSYGVHINGKLAFLANSSDGLLIFDISDPTIPVLLGAYDTPDFAKHVSVAGDIAYVADVNSGLLVLDVSNPGNPTHVLTYDTPGSVVGVTVREGGDVVLTGTGEDPLSSIETPGVPTVYALHQNMPNPFNPATIIRYDLPEPNRVTLQIYNVSGQLVRILREAVYEDSGRHETVWRGLDDSGRAVASGTYFYRLTAGDYVETKMMTLIR